ncbi:ERF family protein [Sediminibacillus massiliensis]|uniref:ERF family protein n=1 Tax=Sediminibacillus massiliensis TaxID=1926277 RepID=UPI0009883AA6|nr:ERF family protein [Sediminibacillus massiliensis]
MSESRKLVSKLAKVMSEVKYIEKKGFNKFQKYKYATESDVAEKVREVLAEQHVVMFPDVVEHSTREHTTRNGNIEYIATVKVKFTFIDGETGEELAIHSIGEGQDSGDKSVYKAITGAQKYALMKAFMIPTGDDPEADNNHGNSNESQPDPLNGEITTKFSEALQVVGNKDKLYEILNTDKSAMSKLIQSKSKKNKENMIKQLEGVINDNRQAG